MSVDSDTLLAILAVCLKKREVERHKRKKRLWMKNTGNNNRHEYTYRDLQVEMKKAPLNDFRFFLANDASIYEELLELVGPLIKKKDTLMREAVPVGLRLSTTLRFLATGNHFQNMTTSSAMSALSISKIVFETCEAIISRLKDYIKLPETCDEWKASANDFNERWEFPNCLGVVGGKHIAIVKPTGSDCLFYNHKKFFSVVLMAIVNSNYEFLAADVDISVNISGNEDFFQTSFGRNIEEHLKDTGLLNKNPKNCPYVFVGDAFKLNENFMNSCQEDNLAEDKQVYNYHLSRVQQVAENTFGALSSRFGVLQKLIHLAPEKVKTIVLACCYLYNFLRMRAEFHQWDGVFDTENFEDGIIINGSWRESPELTSLEIPTESKVSKKAQKVRQQFVDYFKNEGI